ncbi:MAG: helicase-related protein [Candidatus Methanomethylicaceae archaeon]
MFRLAHPQSNLKSYRSIVERVNRLEPEIGTFSDSQLREKTSLFRRRFRSGESLEALMPEVFAVVREASKRTIGLRPLDEQIIGGAVLHQGKIAEMATGEGKTLTAVLSAYLNALSGDKVHVITVNDYLAKRDRNWMGPIYEFLGMKVGLLQASMGFNERKEAYSAEITYGTYNEFIFDFLRDRKNQSEGKSEVLDFLLYGQTISEKDRLLQQGLHFAIIDEIDSILIDAAIQPLSISEYGKISEKVHREAFELAKRLEKGEHFKIDERKRKVEFFPDKVERDFILPIELKGLGRGKGGWENYVEQSLRALHLLKKDRDYIIQDEKIVVVDPFTGRAAPQRTFGEGLHQALEIKENLPLTPESKPVLSITYPLFFKRYKKLAGMTGTASTEAREFKKIYGLEVVSIPTHLPLKRINLPDVIYRTEKEKMKAIVAEIVRLRKEGRPVLVGTNSVAKSESLSKLLTEQGIEHSVLNARHHEKEAEIIAMAGQKGRVTIATSMAGRGVDIVLGDGVRELGGLHIISAEHHDSKRIDDQLRGRAGRRGDPGTTQVFVSLEDDLLRIYRNNKKVQKLIEKLSKDGEEGIPIQSREVERLIQKAQKLIQNFYFQLRRELMKRAETIRKWRESKHYDPVLDRWPDLIF